MTNGANIAVQTAQIVGTLTNGLGQTTASYVSTNGFFKNFIGTHSVGVVDGLIATGIAALAGCIWALVKRNHIMKWFRRNFVVRGKLCKLIRSIKSRRNISVAELLILHAQKATMHLFSPEGKDVTIGEYGDLLLGSLQVCTPLRECIFVARTKPADWFAGHSFAQRTKEYLDAQGALKRDFPKCIVRRYLVLEKKVLDADGKKTELANLHKSYKLDLYHCEEKSMPPDFPPYDMAIFCDITNKWWAIIGLNFNEETIGKYLAGQLHTFKARIESDQGVLTTQYSDLIKTLERQGVSLIT